MTKVEIMGQSSTAQRINELHKGLVKTMRLGIEQAIEIGHLLTETKAELKHGEFTTWVRDNLDFTDRTARNYMRLYTNRDWVLSRTNLSGAYASLADSENGNVSVLKPGDPEQTLATKIEDIDALTRRLCNKVRSVNTAFKEAGIDGSMSPEMALLFFSEFKHLISAVTTMLHHFGIEFKPDPHSVIQQDALPEPIQEAEVVNEPEKSDWFENHTDSDIEAFALKTIITAQRTIEERHGVVYLNEFAETVSEILTYGITHLNYMDKWQTRPSK